MMTTSTQGMLRSLDNLIRGFVLLGLSLTILSVVAKAEIDSPVPPACPTIQMSGSSVNCYGAATGTATVTILAGGSGNYTYTWSNGTVFSGGLTHQITGLSVGTYTVNVRDNVSGCTVIGAFVVGSPDPITVSGVVTNVNCFNDTTGSIDITVNGGTAPYSYSWVNSSMAVVGTNQDLIDAPVGTYTVTVSAPSAVCTFSRSFTISGPIEALNASSIVSDVDCFGGNDGSINVTVWGGTPPYAYSWDSGQTSEDIAGLTSGSYELTITDSRGCQLIVPNTVDQPLMLSGTISSTDVLCFGDATGTVSIVATQGTAPYSYSWQNSTVLYPQNSASLFGVPADTYQATITDANGCTFVSSVVVNQPTELLGTTIGTNVSCYGGSDGEIDLTVSGGIMPYLYTWTNSVPVIVGSSQDLSGLTASLYSVAVIDFNGCVLQLQQEITQPDAPVTSSVVVTDVLCFGDNTGAIDLTVIGGTMPYSYSWTSGQTTQDISNLLAGTYGYTAIDLNGCDVSGSVVISQPAFPLLVTSVITDVNCFGESNGAIDLTVSGGTAPYMYEWQNSTFVLSQTGQDLIGFPADDYSYEVTDNNGCKFIDTVTVSEPPLLEVSVTGVNILCKGGNNGSVDLTVVGGSLPYTYLWNSGAVTEDINTLIAGYYEVLVTDDHGCTAMTGITLTEPADSLDFTFEVFNVLCNNGTDGQIELSVTGGTPLYDYQWSNGGTVSLIENLTAGWYTFLVTDANGCTIADSIEVTQPDPLTLNEVITPVSCFGLSDGSIDISPVGGTAPYSFTWFNSSFALSAQTEDLIDFPADVYQVEIIDTNDCFYEMFFEIEQPDLLVIEYTYNVVSCYGGTDASILVDISGGNPGYTTTWSNGATTEDLLNVPFGIYELDVVDTQGCSDSIVVDISQPDSISIVFEHVAVTCEDQYDGIAYATPSGGNGGYFYNWSNGSTLSFADSLQSEYYFLTVTDVLGCTGYDSVFITKDPEGCIDPVNAFSPNGDQYNDTWVIDNMYLYPQANVQIFNKWGNVIHEQTGVYEPWDGTVNDSPAPSDLYYWIINLNVPEREILKGNITIVR